MEEIKTNRVNGYLDLDNYFINKLNRDYIDEEDLFVNGLIELEMSGVSNKFWILSSEGEKIALFKEQALYSDESYAELFAEEIAIVLNIPTAHYDLAKFNGNKGVISYNFIKQYNEYYSGFDIVSDFYEQKLENDEELSKLYNIDYYNDTIDDVVDKLNNLEDVWFILEERFKNNPSKQYIVKDIVNGLVNRLIFDILTINIDRHVDNWAIIDDTTAPLFDNSRILNMHKNVLTENLSNDVTLEDKELLFTVDNEHIRKPLEVLEHFLKISSSEYKDMVIDKVNNLQQNIEIIPEKIESRTENEMPKYLKTYFINSMHEHLGKVNEVIYKDSKGTKK